MRGDSHPGGGRPAATPTPTPARSRPSARRRWAVVAVACAILSIAAWYAWQRWDLPRRAAAALPARPAIEGWPAEFADRLADAEARAAQRADAIDAVADLARLYHANGFRREAEACWQFLHEEQPREARWSHMLADLRRSASDYEGMETLLREVVRREPDYSPARLRLSDHLLKTGRAAEARRGYSERLARIPGDPWAMLGLARTALLAEQRTEARRLIDEIVATHPRFSAAQNLLAELLAADGDAAGAARHRQLGMSAVRFYEAEDPWLDELIDWCFDSRRLRVAATVQYQTQRGDRGVALMERAVRLAPADPDMLASLGDLHVKLGHAQAARDVLEQVLAHAHTRTPTVLDFVNLGQAYRLLEQPAEALRIAREGLSAHPDAPELHDELGTVLAALGRADESVAAYERARSLGPASADIDFKRAIVLLGAGRRPEAYRALEQSLEINPAFPSALSLLGRILIEDGRLDEAEKHLGILREAYPDVYEPRYMLGQVQLVRARTAEAAGDKARAERHYRHGLVLDGDNHDLQAGLGVMLLVQGKVEQALAPLEAYRRLRPEDPQSALFLGQAYARLGRRDQARAVLTEGVRQAEKIGNRSTADFCREILSHLP
ncbi:hypothetical protein ASA1KI_28190 [Opitutales bacterium ASA1]|nr:hypothetical protein ASA1KI_28190 [Opitutales bacterium ASA1]